MKLYLASGAKHKKSILDKTFLKHELVGSDFNEETISFNGDYYDYVMKLSMGKAESSLNKVEKGIVLGLDTVTVIKGKLAEKPKSYAEALENLKNASNSFTRVITGVSLINKETGEKQSTYQETKVFFNEITQADIDYYFEMEPGYKYAAGMIAETVLSNLINRIDGSFYNVIGVPVEKIYECLRNWNINLNDLE